MRRIPSFPGVKGEVLGAAPAPTPDLLLLMSSCREVLLDVLVRLVTVEELLRMTPHSSSIVVRILDSICSR